jgi:peptide-methionine (R)-S-oxide reductase
VLPCNSQNSIKPTKGEEATVEDHRHDYKYDPPAVEGEFEPFDTTTEYWRSILTAQEFSILPGGWNGAFIYQSTQ